MNWLIKTGIIFVLLVLATTVLIGRLEADFKAYQEAKGIALSDYLSAYQGIDVPASQAQYFQVHINQYDVSIEDIDMYITNLKEKGRQHEK